MFVYGHVNLAHCYPGILIPLLILKLQLQRLDTVLVKVVVAVIADKP